MSRFLNYETRGELPEANQIQLITSTPWRLEKFMSQVARYSGRNRRPADILIAIYVTAAQGELNMLQHLVRLGVRLDDWDYRYLLNYAHYSRRFAVVDWLLQQPGMIVQPSDIADAFSCGNTEFFVHVIKWSLVVPDSARPIEGASVDYNDASLFSQLFYMHTAPQRKLRHPNAPQKIAKLLIENHFCAPISLLGDARVETLVDYEFLRIMYTDEQIRIGARRCVVSDIAHSRCCSREDIQRYLRMGFSANLCERREMIGHVVEARSNHPLCGAILRLDLQRSFEDHRTSEFYLDGVRLLLAYGADPATCFETSKSMHSRFLESAFCSIFYGIMGEEPTPAKIAAQRLLAFCAFRKVPMDALFNNRLRIAIAEQDATSNDWLARGVAWVRQKQIEEYSLAVFEGCIALQALELPALLILEIMEFNAEVAAHMDFDLKWKYVTTVKHFH
jgi:hypothetical protein